MNELYFLSSNLNKYREIRLTLEKHDILLKFRSAKLMELQSDSLLCIALEKSKAAFKAIAKPIIVEDDGLFIHSLGGFPGPYSAFIFKTIGNSGILKLLSGTRDRSASFISIIVYSDGDVTRHFIGKVHGKISLRAKGPGWGYDPVFIPMGSNQSFGQLGERKVFVSHRAKAVTSFARWYGSNKTGVKFIRN